LTAQLRRLRTLIVRGLERTRQFWPDIRCAFAWVHEAARILDNEGGHDAVAVIRRFDDLLDVMERNRSQAGPLAGAIDHFLKVTRSYRPGLFACYRVPDLPRTNNDLEQLFGSHRHHERRATGRKAASPATVLRGSVRLIASTATRLRRYEAHDLAAAARQQWAALRQRLEQRHTARVLRCRFRRNPDAFLKQIETDLLQRTLPA